MRLPFLPPPDPDGLRSRPLQELVRDYPELLGVLGLQEGREGDVGSETLSHIDGHPALLERVLDVLSWRRGSGGEEE